jgi:FkbH-like protein
LKKDKAVMYMKVKLIIWDLDDTLWNGTLAEGDLLDLSKFRADVIRRSNERGIVNAICSKNDFELAKAQLSEYGLWDEFVFPRIEFSPKGSLVSWILESMNLRAENTIFIDDNVMNLKEVEHFAPGITTLDATSHETDIFLQKVLNENDHVNKSRISEYRLLEKKMDDKITSDVDSNEEFLRTCGIKMTLIRRAENLPYVERIEELINRTNQLNFTKNRVEKGAVTEYVLDVNSNDTYSVFVWDNYGVYGLVGFVSTEKNKVCAHFLFSCRTMNMGIEQFLYQQMNLSNYLNLNHLNEMKVDWIQVVNKDSLEFQEVLDKMGSSRSINTHIMANCQSGIISHYLDDAHVSHIDNWPEIFTLSGGGNGSNQQKPHPDAKKLIYGAFNDYNDVYWSETPSESEIHTLIRHHFTEWQNLGLKVIIILPAEDCPTNKYRPDLGVTLERVELWNSVFKLQSKEFGFECWTIDEFMQSDEEMVDVRHYERIIFERIGLRLNEIL